MERREFLSWVSVGVLASSLPAAIAACTKQPETTSASPTESPLATSPRPDGFIPVGTVAQMDQQGFLSNKQSAAGAVIVVRDPKQANKIVALSSVCTHKGCTVEWQKNQALLTCPCHNSAFGIDGSVKKAPATKPLATFAAKIDGDMVLVKA
ncbi:MAG: ubiquinol-cytochrome c reductase iron-sulfur subunit [Scytolyngbya sp. HA4215-MV1]|jgi:cytochrome b6-f complex iron-sulfur subunit|nr:ubiquinol-cytochrome c reductase iron-sulfur subunit [Scytolyngbya sp. HA4215-MV1]